MSATFTPGPWSWDAETGRIYSIPTNLMVALPALPLANPAVAESWPRDAHLISAAPDMFAALREARAMLRSCSLEEPDEEMQATWDKGLAAVDAALVKASPPALNALSAKIEQEHAEGGRGRD